MLGQQSMTAARFVDEKPSKQKRCSLWPIWLALLPVLGWAHHSRLAFDLDASITVEGYVTEVGWTNPHFYLGMREQTDTGEVNWVFEGHSIPGLLRNGWSKTSLRVDDRVRVVANPSRREEVQFALLDHVTRVDGNTFYSFRRPDNARPVQPPLQPATDLTGTWVLIRSLRANLISVVEPPKDWPLQPIAQADVEKFDLRDDPALRCEPLGLPRMLVWPYARRWRALDDGFSVEIEHSEEHRRIYDRAQGHTGTSGISVGTKQPDGSYKIVTTGFVPQPWGNARGIGSSDQKRITELYTLEEGGYKLRLDYSLEDPVYLRAPVTMTESFRKLHDFEFGEEPPCDVATATRHLDFER